MQPAGDIGDEFLTYVAGRSRPGRPQNLRTVLDGDGAELKAATSCNRSGLSQPSLTTP
jgi:hypothetical protein